MTSATLLAAVLAAAPPPQAPSARVVLKAEAASAASCRTTRIDDKLVGAALFSPESSLCPVATVGGEPITVGELAGAVEFEHVSGRTRAASGKRPKMDFSAPLERLITTRLIVQEAREMQLDATPEFRAAMDGFKDSTLRKMLQREAAKGARPDPAEVERLYRDAVREYRLSSVLIEKEDDAKAFQAALASGGTLEALATKAVAEKKGKGWGKSEFAPRKHVLPEILAAVQDAKPGAPVGPVRVPSGWVWLRVDGTRYPKGDAAARAQARQLAGERAEHEAVRRFYLSLVKKHAKIDDALVKQLDFEAKGEEGFNQLLADQRPVVTIAGARPITVGDLAREVSTKFFHGMGGPIKEKRVNAQKDAALERVLGARLFAREAEARKLASRTEFVRGVAEAERALAFNTFVEKVIAPEVKLTEKETIEAYEQHKAEYTAPEMLKLDGIAFASAGAAQAAIDKLRAGTDFGWFVTNSPQLPPEKRTVQFDGRTVSVNALPPALAKALVGVHAGEYRLYAASDHEVYVVRVVDQTPPSTKPYADAREAVARKLLDERFSRAIREYADRLRKAQRVDVLIAEVSL